MGNQYGNCFKSIYLQVIIFLKKLMPGIIPIFADSIYQTIYPMEM